MPAPAPRLRRPTRALRLATPGGSYVYLLLCRDGSLYCGWSTDPAERERTHNAGRGAAYTRSRRPVQLVYIESAPSRSAALKREHAIKRLSRSAKLILVRRRAGRPS